MIYADRLKYLQSAEEMLVHILEGTSRHTGVDFFQSLAKYLAQTLKFQYAFIGRVVNPEKINEIETLAVWGGDKITANFTYDLDGTPCQNVMKQGLCFYSKRVQQLFPKDKLLVEMNVHSYAGIPLRDSKDNVIGILVLLDTEPMDAIPYGEQQLTIFANRASAELERVQTEEALKNREDQLKNLLSNVNAIILEGDPFNIYYVGGRAEKILGYPIKDWFKEPGGCVGFWTKLLHPDDIDKVEIYKNAILKGENHSFEYRLKAKNGTYKWFYDSITVETEKGIPVKARSIMVDITKRKQSEEEIESIFNMTGYMVCVADINTASFLRINSSFEYTLGYSKEELLSKSFFEFIHPDDKQRTLDVIEQKLKDNIQVIGFENRYRCKDGTYKWLSWTSRPVVEKGITYAIAYDITKRKATEEKLKNSGKRSRAWLENSPVCTKIIDLDFNLQYMSTAGIKGLKIENVKEYYGKPFPFDFYSRSVKKTIIKNLKKVKKTDEIVELETPAFDAEGNGLWFHSTFVPVNDDEGQIDYIIAVSSDITKRKQAEKALRGSEAELRIQKAVLVQKNAALHEILEYIEIEKQQIKDDVMANIDNVIMPSLEKLKLKGGVRKHVNVIEHYMEDMASSFGKKISEKSAKLTSREIEICSMVKTGLTNKEIASLLSISLETVEKHRRHIRKKLGISKKRINLTTYLKTL